MKAQDGFYNLVDNVKRDEVILSLMNDNIEIALKINIKHCRAKILAKRNANEFLISQVSKEKFKDERITCSFEFKRNKYFFKTLLTSNVDGMTILSPTELFQLQRRDNFRMVIPIGVKYVAELQSINGKRINEKMEIRDISLGGCQVVFKKIAIKINPGDHLQIKIQMLDLDKELISCQAKHVLPLQSDTKVQLGMTLTEPDANLLRGLQSLLIHLNRIHRGKKYE